MFKHQYCAGLQNKKWLSIILVQSKIKKSLQIKKTLSTISVM